MPLRHLTTAIAICALGGTALAQDLPNIGPKLGIYFPTSSAAKEAFGDNWFSFGIGAVSRENFAEPRALVYDFNVLARNSRGNRVFILNPSVGYRWALAEEGSSAIPYVAVRGGLSYVDYAIGSGEDRVSTNLFGLNTNAELGVQIDNSLTIFVRYDLYAKSGMFNFDGFTLAANFALIRF